MAYMASAPVGLSVQLQQSNREKRLKNKDVSGGLRGKEREKNNMVKIEAEEEDQLLSGKEHAKAESLQMLKEAKLL